MPEIRTVHPLQCELMELALHFLHHGETYVYQAIGVPHDSAEGTIPTIQFRNPLLETMGYLVNLFNRRRS